MFLRLFREFDSRTVREHLERLWKRDVLDFHHERENVSTVCANPATKRLALWIDLETWFRIVVPWAQTNVNSAFWLKLNVFTDQVHDINGLAYALFYVQ